MEKITNFSDLFSSIPGRRFFAAIGKNYRFSSIVQRISAAEATVPIFCRIYETCHRRQWSRAQGIALAGSSIYSAGDTTSGGNSSESAASASGIRIQGGLEIFVEAEGSSEAFPRQSSNRGREGKRLSKRDPDECGYLCRC